MPRQPFAAQRGGQRKRTLAAVKQYITDLSGGSVTELLRDIFESNFGHQVFQGVKNATDKLQQLVSHIHAQCDHTRNFYKRQWSSLVSTIFSRRELENLGWKLSPKVSGIVFVDDIDNVGIYNSHRACQQESAWWCSTTTNTPRSSIVI